MHPDPVFDPVFDTPTAVRSWSDAAHRTGLTVALVPTMGALHRGHVALIEHARTLADRVVVSIFVNPLQFGEQNDFDHYPRPIADDLAECRRAGVDAVYAPTAAAMYPPGFETRVVAGSLGASMEGAARPGHFDGVVTVVTKLFAATRPDVGVFGQKDFQQLAIIRRLAADLDLGVQVIGAPTVREPDGLALSSRNRRLDTAHRAAAACVPRAIAAAVERAATHGARVDDVIAAATEVLRSEPLATLDYVSVFDADTLEIVEALTEDRRRNGRTRIALAARFGEVRLIDNDDLFRR
ncbi:MAG: pantoate--beta-alanine ligase [Ilumatobacteraceae bacterium]